MRYAPIQFVVNQSMAADITSKAIPINQVFGYAVQAVYSTSGTLGGTLALQASVDHVEDNEGNILFQGHFDTITNSPVVLTGAGSFTWNVATSNYMFFRLIYTHATGDSGTLSAKACTKGF